MTNVLAHYPAERYVDDADFNDDPLCKRCMRDNCDYVGIVGVWACHGFHLKTNYDRIQQMRDKELAVFLATYMDCEQCPVAHDEPIKGEEECHRRLLAWLEQEYYEE